MAKANFPASPTNGQTVVIGGITYIYNSSKGIWRDQISNIGNTSDTPPANAVDGQLWYNSSNGALYVYYDDGTSTQWVGVSGPAGAAGAAGAAGTDGSATVVTDMAGLIAVTGMSAGQTVLVTTLNKVFMYTGSAWYLIATMTNSSPTDITGVNSTYLLATDGTATTITAVSTDPEGFPLTWSYAVTSGSLGSTATVSQADNVFTITPSSTVADAGTFSITFSVTDGTTGAVQTVSAFSLGFGFDLTNVAYDNLSFSVYSQDTAPSSLAFNSDGTKMFVLGGSGDDVNQYSLTNGFSLAAGNVSYDNLSFSVASQETSPTGLAFNSDGTRMFVVGASSDAVHQYSLTNGFSLATGNVTYDNINFNVASQDTAPQDLTFNSDGTKMFVVGTGDAVYQYSLTNGFSMAAGNVTYDNLSFSVASQDTVPLGFTFNSDGTRMFVVGSSGDAVYQYSLTNGFSMAAGNVTYDNLSFSVASQATTPTGLAFNSDGTRMFVVGSFSDAVHQYTTSA